MKNKPDQKLTVGILGATGYAGAELVRILSGHPRVSLTVLTSRQYAGARFDQVYPSMKGRTPLVCEALSMERLKESCAVIFSALPHKIPMSIIPELMAAGKRVIDLSADFRFNDPALYESVYQCHTAPELLGDAGYGLSEIYTDAIRDAMLIGNPGCYPTSALLPLIPLLRHGWIDANFLTRLVKNIIAYKNVHNFRIVNDNAASRAVVDRIVYKAYIFYRMGGRNRR